MTVYHIDPQLRTPGGIVKPIQTKRGAVEVSNKPKELQNPPTHVVLSLRITGFDPSANMTIDIQGVLWQSSSKLQWPG